IVMRVGSNELLLLHPGSTTREHVRRTLVGEPVVGCAHDHMIALHGDRPAETVEVVRIRGEQLLLLDPGGTNALEHVRRAASLESRSIRTRCPHEDDVTINA